MKQSQGGSGGGKTWAKCINNKVRTNKTQRQRKINKKENGNGDTKKNNEVHLVDNKWVCLCSKGFGFNTSHTTGFHDTWATCVNTNDAPVSQIITLVQGS